MSMFESAACIWHPIAASHDLPFRHVFHGQLLGRDLALWRADDGYVNVWENRCLHRGVRLSIGINDGRELKCQYHGWRYSNRTAGCTYIPAHPADAPARTICNRTFNATERYGLVWSSEHPTGSMPDIAGLRDDRLLVLRPIPVNAPANIVLDALKEYGFQPNDRIGCRDADIVLEQETQFCLVLQSSAGGAKTRAVFFVQPVDSHRSVIRGVLDSQPNEDLRMVVLHHHNDRLSRLRDTVESQAATQPLPDPLVPAIEGVSEDLSQMPDATTVSGRQTIRVEVARKWPAADGVAGFELKPIEGMLPTFQPGAHIDVHLPNGLVRQYSIVNGPGESDSYVIGVKLEYGSRGGSVCLHDTVRQGDLLAISAPRNNYPLRRNAVKTILVAGGIGVTPLLSMALALQNQSLDYALHYFAQDEGQLAFPERTRVLGNALTPHIGLSPEGTADALLEVLSDYCPGMNLYCCGPAPMLEAVRHVATELGWPETSIFFEYFKNPTVIDNVSSFEIALARSCVTLEVPAGRTILDVVREAGISMPSACEQGACGTCLATVIEGEPHHQDVYLNEAEKKFGNKIMTCVSRAKSARLVLDL